MAKIKNEELPTENSAEETQAQNSTEEVYQEPTAPVNPFAESQTPVLVMGLGKQNSQGALLENEPKYCLPSVANILVSNGEARPATDEEFEEFKKLNAIK